jgi:predicted DCC family thiol-disulfide oxidoreductase YuxK
VIPIAGTHDPERLRAGGAPGGRPRGRRLGPSVKSPPVVLFDGVCNLCDASVSFIIDRDPTGHFQFAALQSAAAKPYLAAGGLPRDFLDGIVLCEEGRCFTRSTAILRILKRLRGISSLLYVLILVPRPLRDAAYDWFIRRRYRWFGKREACRVPTPEVQARFLGGGLDVDIRES